VDEAPAALTIFPATALLQKDCHQWIERQTGCAKALLTHPARRRWIWPRYCCDSKAADGDSAVLHFVSTANAIRMSGAVSGVVESAKNTLIWTNG